MLKHINHAAGTSSSSPPGIGIAVLLQPLHSFLSRASLLSRSKFSNCIAKIFLFSEKITKNQNLPNMSSSSGSKTPSEDPLEGFPDITALSTTEYLERLCNTMTSYLNDHPVTDYKPVMDKYLSPNFKYEAEGPSAFLNSNDREEYYNKLVALTKNAPDLKVEPTDILADVDEVRGKATLRSSSRVTAVFETSSMIVRECIEVTRWTRHTDGDWVCDRLTLMTGPGSSMFNV